MWDEAKVREMFKEKSITWCWGLGVEWERGVSCCPSHRDVAKKDCSRDVANGDCISIASAICGFTSSPVSWWSGGKCYMWEIKEITSKNKSVNTEGVELDYLREYWAYRLHGWGSGQTGWMWIHQKLHWDSFHSCLLIICKQNQRHDQFFTYLLVMPPVHWHPWYFVYSPGLTCCS